MESALRARRHYRWNTRPPPGFGICTGRSLPAEGGQRQLVLPKPVQFVCGHPVHARLALIRAYPPVRTKEVLRIAYLLTSMTDPGSGGSDAVNAAAVHATRWWVPFGCSAFIESVRLRVPRFVISFLQIRLARGTLAWTGGSGHHGPARQDWLPYFPTSAILRSRRTKR